MAARKPVPGACRTAMPHAAAILLLLLACSPADAHRKMAPLKCQALPGTTGACNEVFFENYATQVPLTNVHQAGGMGNPDQSFRVVPLAPWGTTTNGVPHISMCRGPGLKPHQWGVQKTSGQPVYARAGSMLQYSYDGLMGGYSKACSAPTYPGPVLATKQDAGRVGFNFRNLAGNFHPLNFAVDPRLYSAAGVTKTPIKYDPRTAAVGKPSNDVPGVVHVHGLVAPSEFDGVPYFTLTTTGRSLLHKFKGISNPPALALYHDHSWGFTRLSVYAGAVSGFLVKENNATNMGQPKPTNPCTTAKPTDTCGIPEIGVPPANSMPGYSDLQDIPLIIADKALVAPELGTNGLEAELGYPVGQPLLCNSCTPPGQANGGDPPPLDASAKYCTSQFFRNVCPAVWVPNPPSYCGRWSPEFFGPVNVVNGQVTPVLKLYPGWFRLRLVNGANTRTYKLQFKADLSSTLTKDLLIKCSKIATEAGYVKYPKPVATPLVMAPAERVELLCDLTGFKEDVSYLVTNADPNPADNKGQEEVMKITISPDLKGTVANKIGPQEPPTTYLNPDKPLATIPDLRVLYEAQVNLNPANKVEKHIMLLERLAGGCPQGLAVSECKDASGNPGSPVTDPGNLNTATGWAGIPNNCLNKEHMPRNMFADGVPLTCKEGLIEKWNWYNPTADPHPWHWHLNHVQCFPQHKTNPTSPNSLFFPEADGANELKETVLIPNVQGDVATPTLVCYVVCADAQYILNSGELLGEAPYTLQEAEGALLGDSDQGKPGIAKGYRQDTGPFATGKRGTCSTTATAYSNWDYVTHCHILEHEEYDMMAKFRILPKNQTQAVFNKPCPNY